MLPKDLRQTLLKERLKGAEDWKKLHDKNLNRTNYHASKDDTAALFFWLDVGSQWPQLPVCMNAF